MKGRLRNGIAAVAMTWCSSATNGATPDLAQALQKADTVVVARVVSGNAQSSSTGASGELLLPVMRTLEGQIKPGSQIAVTTRGSRLFIPGPVSNAHARWVVEHFTALWFLIRQGQHYAVVPVTPSAGEPERAGLLLPEQASPTTKSQGIHRAIAEEIVATLRAMSAAHPNEIKPIYHVQTINGNVDRSFIFGKYAVEARQLSEALETIGGQPTRLAVYRELAFDPGAYLRAAAIAGLIAANEPAGSIQAAAELRDSFRDANPGPIALNLAGYRNPDDREAILALGRIATDFADLDMPLLQKAPRAR